MISRLLAVTFLLLTLALATTHAQTSPTIKLNSTHDEVIAALGEPKGILKQGKLTILVYPGGEIEIQNDRVIKVASAYQDPAEHDEFAMPAATADGTNEVTQETTTAVDQPNPLPPWLGALDKLRGTNTTSQTGETKPKPAFVWAGVGVIVLGALATLAGNIWLLVKAFTEHVGWGIACLLVPLVMLVFVAMHWSDSWKPFVLSLGGAAAVVGGAALAMFGLAG